MELMNWERVGQFSTFREGGTVNSDLGCKCHKMLRQFTVFCPLAMPSLAAKGGPLALRKAPRAFQATSSKGDSGASASRRMTTPPRKQDNPYFRWQPVKLRSTKQSFSPEKAPRRDNSSCLAVLIALACSKRVQTLREPAFSSTFRSCAKSPNRLTRAPWRKRSLSQTQRLH